MAEQRIETRLYLAADLAPGVECRLDPAPAIIPLRVRPPAQTRAHGDTRVRG